MNCQLCNEYGDKLKLVGSVPAQLCVHHHQLWEMYCCEQPEYSQLVKLRDQYVIMLAILQGGRGDAEMVAVAAAQMRAVEVILVEKARAWLRKKEVERLERTVNDED